MSIELLHEVAGDAIITSYGKWQFLHNECETVEEAATAYSADGTGYPAGNDSLEAFIGISMHLYQQHLGTLYYGSDAVYPINFSQTSGRPIQLSESLDYCGRDTPTLLSDLR